MRRSTPLVIAAGILLLAPGGASAATLAASPKKPCYRSGERLALGGTGYSPSSTVTVTSNGEPIGGPQPTDLSGAFEATLTPRLRQGQSVKRYVARDDAAPSLSASTRLRISALDVLVRPRTGRPDQRRRIVARGFTTGRTLYAHVKRRAGRRARNVKIGRLTGRCHRLRQTRALFRRAAAPGLYRVQFDTRRRYSRRTPARVAYTVRVYSLFAAQIGRGR